MLKIHILSKGMLTLKRFLAKTKTIGKAYIILNTAKTDGIALFSTLHKAMMMLAKLKSKIS
ncbi:MAG: hypothetical protein IJS61_00480 [Firmicutes bacterium]|nr:hypothetical protein [Bacillota bacterium]